MIVLNSLRSEGTPRMALDLCRFWRAWGVRPIVVSLERAAGQLREEFEKLELEIRTAPMPIAGYRRYLRLAATVHRLCCEIRPRALLCMPFGLHSFVALGARVARVPRVCVHVGNPPPGNLKSGAIAWIGVPFTYRVVCCSQYVQEATWRAVGLPRRSMEVIYNGAGVVDQLTASGTRGREGAGSRYGTNEKGAVVGMVATLEGHKDQETLIRAAARLRDRGQAIEVRLLGDGHRRQELAELIDTLQAPARLMGSCLDIPEQLASMDVFAFSTTEQEGLGIALIEAMAAGLPIVASDVPACREVLDDDNAGLLVEPGDPDAMAAGIERVFADPVEAQRRAEYARERARCVFSAEAMAHGYALVLGLPILEHVENKEFCDVASG